MLSAHVRCCEPGIRTLITFKYGDFQNDPDPLSVSKFPCRIYNSQIQPLPILALCGILYLVVRVWRGVLIGSIQYKIILASPEENPDLINAEAITYYEKAEIWIRNNIAPERFAPALFHELAHAAIEATSAHTLLVSLCGKKWTDDAEEQLIRALESTMVGPLHQLGWRPRPRLRKCPEPY